MMQSRLLCVAHTEGRDAVGGQPTAGPTKGTSLGICLNCEGLQEREMKDVEGKRRTKPEKVTDTFVSPTERNDKERRG